MIGKRLFEALKMRGINNVEVTKAFGLSPQYVSNLKASDKLNDVMAKIALKYNVNIRWILTDIGAMYIDDTHSQQYDNTNLIYRDNYVRLEALATLTNKSNFLKEKLENLFNELKQEFNF